VLTEDITIAGPIAVSLVVSTSGTDADWVVKLIDVFPDTLRQGPRRAGAVPLAGYQMLVRGDVLRGKFRSSLARPEPFQPGAPTPIAFTLQDALHTFRRGHRIMVQIQSSWFPMVDRNPGTFMDIFQATEADYRATTQRIWRSPSHLSMLTLKRLR
jgi:putative CocE/NonD family hydrolase